MIETPFTTGGPVHVDDEKIYIRRKADQQLLKYCLDGEYSVILTSRQMGKTSLLYHTIKELKQYDVSTVYIDLNKIGTGGVSADDWFKSILDIIREHLNLEVDIESFWNNFSNLSHGLRFYKFMRDVALKSIGKKLIIFIDEIELTTQLEYSDSFFSVIRSLYTERGANLDIKRLSFVLAGMARISDLIKQPDITTFNIGKRIDLNNFSLAEIIPLTKNIPHQIKNNDLISNWVIKWTGGQPFLTQLLCEHLSLSDIQIESEEQVESVVLELIMQPDLQDKHINTIQRYLLSKPSVNVILGLYALVLVGKSIPNFDGLQAVQYTKLAGLFVVQDGYIKICNDIYRYIFNLEWVEKQLKNIHTSLDIAISIAQNAVESFSENLDLRAKTDEEEDANKKLEEISSDVEAEERSSRIFSITAGILGAIVLASLAILVVFYFFSLTSQSSAAIPTPSIGSNTEIKTIYPNSIITLLIFGIAILAVMLTVGLVVSTNSYRQSGTTFSKKDRLKLAEERKIEAGETAEFWKNKVKKTGLIEQVNNYIAQADVKLKIGEIFSLLLISSLAFALIAFLLSGASTLSLVAGGVWGFCIPVIYINSIREKRLKNFIYSLPEALYMLTSGIKSGYSVFHSIESVTQNVSGIVSDEFSRVLWEVQINVDQARAFAHMLERIPSADLSSIVGMVNLHREIGVRLVNVFDLISLGIRNKTKDVSLHFGLLQFYMLLFVEYFLVFGGLSVYTSVALSTPTGNLFLILNLAIMSFAAVVLGKRDSENKLLFAFAFGGLFLLLPWTGNSGLHVFLIMLMSLSSNLIYWMLSEFLVSTHRLLFSATAWIGGILLSTMLLQQKSNMGIINANPNHSITYSTYVIWVIVILIIVLGSVTLIYQAIKFKGIKPNPNERAYREYYRGKSLTLADFELSLPFSERVVLSVLRRVGELAISFTPQYTYEATSRKLEESGQSGWLDAPGYLGMKLLFAFLGLGLSILWAFNQNKQYLGFAVWFAIPFSFLGYVAPEAWLDNKIRNRKDDIENELPYAVNLLKVCSDVGLNLTGAIKAVYESWDSNLAIEFGRATREIQLGKGVRETLNDMAIRINVPHFTGLINALVQGDYLGVSLSNTLHAFYDQMLTTPKTNNKNLDQASVLVAIALSIVIWIALLTLGQALAIR